MALNRLVKGLRSLHRINEISHCISKSGAPFKEICAYLGFSKLKYPYEMSLKNGLSITLESWEDLTTAWVVFFGNEYNLNARDKTVVDLGANIGAFSLHVAHSLPNVKIYSVEPFPSTFAKLCENIQRNHLDSRIECLNVASVGESQPVYMDENDGIPSHSRKTDAKAGLKIQGLSLKDIFNRFGLTHVNFLKVDIEGAEYELFGKTPVADMQCVDRIGLEYHGSGSREKLFDHLHKAGFKVSSHSKKGFSGLVEFIRKTTS